MGRLHVSAPHGCLCGGPAASRGAARGGAGPSAYRQPAALALDLEDVRATLRRARSLGLGCATDAGPGRATRLVPTAHRAARAGSACPGQPPRRRAGNGRALQNRGNPASHPRPRCGNHLMARRRGGAAVQFCLLLGYG